MRGSRSPEGKLGARVPSESWRVLQAPEERFLAESELHACGLEYGVGNSTLTSVPGRSKHWRQAFRGVLASWKMEPLKYQQMYVCEQTVAPTGSKCGEGLCHPDGSFRPHAFVYFDLSYRISVLCIMRALERMFSVSFPLLSQK